MTDNSMSGLPAELASVLRDQSVIVPQDAAVFDMIASWANAPTSTASAGVSEASGVEFFEGLRQQVDAPTTTGIGC